MFLQMSYSCFFSVIQSPLFMVACCIYHLAFLPFKHILESTLLSVERNFLFLLQAHLCMCINSCNWPL